METLGDESRYRDQESVKIGQNQGRFFLRYEKQAQASLSAWQRHVCETLIQVLRIDLNVRVQPLAHQRQVVKFVGYQRELWEMQTEEGVWMPFYLLRPDNLCKPAPTVIITHGHAAEGKEAMIHHDPNFPEQFVALGYLVVCPDARGAGERILPRYKNRMDGSICSHNDLSKLYLCNNRTLLGAMILDLMRLVDYLMTLPEVDQSQIGCAGMSGGGQQSLWLGALDTRMKVISTSGYFYGMQESLYDMPENCSCNFVPGLVGLLDMGDLGALIAPRILHIESGLKDPLNGFRGEKNVIEQFQIAKVAFEQSNSVDCLRLFQHPQGHIWVGRGMIETFKEAFSII